jgi:hypothetical protein
VVVEVTWIYVISEFETKPQSAFEPVMRAGAEINEIGVPVAEGQ